MGLDIGSTSLPIEVVNLIVLAVFWLSSSMVTLHWSRVLGLGITWLGLDIGSTSLPIEVVNLIVLAVFWLSSSMVTLHWRLSGWLTFRLFQQSLKQF